MNILPWIIGALVGSGGAQASSRAGGASAAMSRILGISEGRQKQFDALLKGLLEQGLYRTQSVPYFGGVRGGRAFGALRGGRRPLPTPGFLGE